MQREVLRTLRRMVYGAPDDINAFTASGDNDRHFRSYTEGAPRLACASRNVCNLSGEQKQWYAWPFCKSI